jgi:hypothetical protein
VLQLRSPLQRCHEQTGVRAIHERQGKFDGCKQHCTFAETCNNNPMTTSRPPGLSAEEYALSQAQEAFTWYMNAGRKAKVRYQIVELMIIAVSTAVTITGVLYPHDARVPAILGALVAALATIRSMNHWRDNWTRFTLARTELRSQMRLYRADAAPYDNSTTKAEILVRTVNAIQIQENQGWFALLDKAEGSSKAH